MLDQTKLTITITTEHAYETETLAEISFETTLDPPTPRTCKRVALQAFRELIAAIVIKDPEPVSHPDDPPAVAAFLDTPTR